MQRDFVEPLEPIYPILCQAGTGEYSTGGVPTSYLISPDGKVVWHGHPNNLKDEDLAEQLKEVEKEHRASTWAFMLSKALPPMPDRLSGVDKLLEKRDFGKALKKVESTIEKLEGEDAEAGEQIRAWIEKRGTDAMEKAAALVREGEVYKGFLVYEKVEGEFKGHDIATQAKNAAKALTSDKATALEIKASEKFEEIKREMADEKDPEDQLKVLKPLLASKYEETKAGKAAAELAKELESKLEK